MKKLVLIAAALLMTTVGFAQKQERTNAYMYNKNGQLDKAKVSIEKAMVHEKTINDARTWEYAGIIYYNIAVSPEFNSIEPEALDKSFNAFKKCMELDMNFAQENAQDIVPRVNAVSTLFFQKGVEGFNTANFEMAADNFKKSFDVAQLMGKNDVDALTNAAMASVKCHRYQEAVSYYMQLKALGQTDAEYYKWLATAFKGMGETERMMSTIAEGREKYPEDSNLMAEEINALLEQGKATEALEPLKEMIKVNPTNAALYFILANVYGNDANGDIYSTDSAEFYYKKCLSVDENMTDAAYNLSSLYIAKSNKLIAQANDLPLSKQKEYDNLMEQANGILNEALPYLEKAYAAQPDETLKSILKTVYQKLKMNDKAKELN